MTVSTHVISEKIEQGIALITLNRSEKRNALNGLLLEELCNHVLELQENPELRVIIFRGEGPIFCSGMDLLEASNPELIEHTAMLISKMLSTIYHCPLVTIAAVHGAALAGGIGLLGVCDICIAAIGTKFGFPETRRGLVPAQIATILVRLVRERDLRALFLLGEIIEAEEAFRIGLINKIVEREELLDQAIQMGKMAMGGAPNAIKQTKRLLDMLNPSDFGSDLQKALSIHESSRRTREAEEGISAFLEKRSPNWSSS